MKEEVDTIEEAEAIVNPLLAENKWSITVAITPAKKYLVQWLERKMYTAQDGKEYPDEVWMTIDGEMKLIQDLEPEHARNIIRMMLRNERERAQEFKDLFARVAAQIAEDLDEDTPGDTFTPPLDNRGTLH